jgi:hypothetical protein
MRRKMLAVNRGQEFVIGGYTRGGTTFDALVFGYYEEGSLLSPICQRSTRAVGPGLNRRKDERMSPDKTSIGGPIRIRGVDARSDLRFILHLFVD